MRKLIAGLQARGLQPGDSVCLHSFNNFSYSLVYLAAIGAGGCFVGSNPAYTKFELNHLFSISRVRFIVVEPELLEKILPALKECGIPQSSVFVFDTHGRDTPDGFESWDVLLEYGEKDWESFDNEERSKSTPASLVSTSGTTGLPKAATISHYSLISQNVIMYDSRDKPYETLRLIGLPQFHSFAVPLVHIAPLREGHPTYIMRRYDTDQYVEYIDRYQITETSMVTPIVLNCINLSPSRMRCLGSLRFIWAGGAPLNASVQRQLKEKLHQECIFSQVWGLSEYGWITVFPYPETHIGSVGRLLPSTEAK